MVKIYSLAAGKKIRVLGTGENFTKAVEDALNNGYFLEIEGVDPENMEQLENYILGAQCDYKIEYIK